MASHLPIQTILVAQGAEYQAVCRGLRRVTATKPLVVPIPMGPQAFAKHLAKLQQKGHFFTGSQPKVLLMGLCGSLSHNYRVGDIMIYKDCIYEPVAFSRSDRQTTQEASAPLLSTDRQLTSLLHEKLQGRASLVRGLTSDRFISCLQEKQHFGQIYQAQVVDMEGFTALDVLRQAGVAVAMVRVVSDDAHHNLPDLTSAISGDGSLQPLPLAIGLLRQPIAAMQLIRGSMRGLQVLRNVATILFMN